jgi:NAD(P)-dependent dehydrogenase (short-subunit alcohol dehydrogenase family)
MRLTSDHVALISGGASGLGAAAARRLHHLGAQVVLVDLDQQVGTVLAAALGERATFVRADVTDEAAVTAAVDAARERGELRVAVSCAGVGWASRILTREGPHELDLFKRVININLVGTFNVLRLAAAAMSELEPLDGDRGVIVNTASIAAFDGQIGQVAYAASKGGVAAMTLPAARDLARHRIRVMTIAPGTFDTPMLAGVGEDIRAALAEQIPHPARLGDPVEYGLLVEQVVAHPYLNGEVIRLDGALRMGPR